MNAHTCIIFQNIIKNAFRPSNNIINSKRKASSNSVKSKGKTKSFGNYLKDEFWNNSLIWNCRKWNGWSHARLEKNSNQIKL